MFDKTALELRERSGFESLDAGLFLYRRLFPRIQARVLPFYLPFVVAIGFVPKAHLWIPALVIWFFSPLLGRLALKPLAHAFFGLSGKPPWKGTFRGVLGDLSWRRFSPWRHYVLPVRVLEGIRGSRLRKRIAHIRGEGPGVAFAMNAVVFLGEFILLAGMIAFVVSMQNFIPHALRKQLDFETPGVWHAIVIAYALLVGFWEPAAASMGFGLYIDRRVTLEGWDLEIAFSRWARRLGSGMSVLLAVLAFFAAPAGAWAAKPPENDVPRESLDRVLSSDDFGEERERTGWRWKTNPEKKDSFWDDLFGSLNPDRTRGFAEALRIVVIALLATAVLFVLWKNRGILFAGGSPRKPGIQDDSTPFPTRETRLAYERGLAMELMNEGRVREAWALAYAGAVDAIARNAEEAPGPEATEGEWLKILAEADAGNQWIERHRESLKTLIERWRALAYAHRSPGEEAFREAVSTLDSCGPSAPAGVAAKGDNRGRAR